MLSLLVAVLLAVGVSAVPIIPAADPFYVPPVGWESKAPGTVLRSRTVTLSMASTIAVSDQSYQLLFRSNDILNNPLAVVTTVVVPLSPISTTLLAWGVAEDSINTRCAPSYAMQLGSGSTDEEFFVEEYLYEAALAQGYFITIPDHQGPNSAYNAGRQQGKAVLDAIRATLSFGSNIGLSAQAKVGIYGYSGGAVAAGWAASLQKSYAPTLNIVGTAIGGTPANLTAVTLFQNGEFNAGYALATLVGLANAYPKFAASFASLATPTTLALIAQDFADVCNGDPDADDLNFFNTTTFFTSGAETLYNPVWQETLIDSTLGLGGSAFTPSAPVYIFHAENDNYIPYSSIQVLVNEWCNGGATLDFVSVSTPSVEHVIEQVLGVPGAMVWLSERFAGTPQSGGCVETVETMSVASSEATAAALPAFSKVFDAAVALAISGGFL